MNLLALFQKGDEVWVNIGATVFTFVNGVVKHVEKGRVDVLNEDGVYSTYSLEEAKERVFRKTALVNIFARAFLDFQAGACEHQLSKEQLIQEMKDEMLSLQFCDSCQQNEGIQEKLSIDGLHFVGSIYDLFGEVDNYKLEGVYTLNGVYYVSYDAGNGHCHIGKMDSEMVEDLKNKEVKS